MNELAEINSRDPQVSFLAAFTKYLDKNDLVLYLNKKEHEGREIEHPRIQYSNKVFQGNGYVVKTPEEFLNSGDWSPKRSQTYGSINIHFFGEYERVSASEE